MDAINEKKWFVYLGDKHEGPFSMEEIQGKMADGVVSTANYVWAEGMQDWKAMKDVPDFVPLVAPTPARSQAAPILSHADEAAASEPLAAAVAVSEDEDTGKVFIHPASQTSGMAMEATSAQPAADGVERDAPKKKSSVLRGIKVLIFFAAPAGIAGAFWAGKLDPMIKHPAVQSAVASLSDTARPLTLKLTDRAPFLAPFFSPLPSFPDAAMDEYEELKVAARSLPDAPSYSLALATADLLNPSFYVAAHVADGKQVRIWVTGLGDTLLNHTAFENSTVVTLERRWGKSQPVRFTDGKPVPRGEYIVTVYEESPAAASVKAEERGKLLFKRTYFLGGAKDASYTERLAEYHEKLKAKAQSELNELRDFVKALEMQLSTTQLGFNKYKAKTGKPGKQQLKGWQDLHGKWAELESQLAGTFQKWTPEAAPRDFFYFPIYLLVKQSSESLSALHQLHQSYFEGTAMQLSEIEANASKAITDISTAIVQIKEKIEQAEKLPKSPLGLPTREGL